LGYAVYDIFSSILIQNSIIDNTIYNYFGGSLVINNTYLGYGVVGNASPSYTGTNDISNFTPPAFVDTANNNFSLLPCSVTINAGDNTVNNTQTDLAGNPRKYGTIDMGAYEYERISTMPDTVYVNAASTAVNPNGSSWAQAFPELFTALNLTCNNAHTKNIWVAKGTYAPGHGQDRTVTFSIPNGTKVYGGFSGGETSLNARDSTGATNLTTLSGEMQGDNNLLNNAFHVVFVNADSTTELNGFTITGGYGNDPDMVVNNISGGGILTVYSSAIFSNLHINNNVGGFYGGGIANFGGSILVKDVTFEKDTSGVAGGAVYNDGTGGISGPFLSYNTSGPARYENDTFVNNYCDFIGGAFNSLSLNTDQSYTYYLNNIGKDYGGAISISNSNIKWEPNA
jgi:hypothetical protein